MTKYITYLQLRAARNVCDLGVRDLAKVLNISKAGLSKAEQGKTRDFMHKRSAALIEYFKRHHITFPNEYSMQYDKTENSHNQEDDNLLTRFQLKAARYIINISQKELGSYVDHHQMSIFNAEHRNNEKYIEFKNDITVSKLKRVFESYNILFPDRSSIFFKEYVDAKKQK